jgi:hypothetical protein
LDATGKEFLNPFARCERGGAAIGHLSRLGSGDGVVVVSSKLRPVSQPRDGGGCLQNDDEAESASSPVRVDGRASSTVGLMDERTKLTAASRVAGRDGIAWRPEVDPVSAVRFRVGRLQGSTPRRAWLLIVLCPVSMLLESGNQRACRQPILLTASETRRKSRGKPRSSIPGTSSLASVRKRSRLPELEAELEAPRDQNILATSLGPHRRSGGTVKRTASSANSSRRKLLVLNLVSF